MSRVFYLSGIRVVVDFSSPKRRYIDPLSQAPKEGSIAKLKASLLA